MIFFRLDPTDKAELIRWTCAFAAQFPSAEVWNGKGCNTPSHGDIVLWFRDDRKSARECIYAARDRKLAAFIVNIVVGEETDSRHGEIGAPGRIYYEIGREATGEDTVYSLVTNLENVIPYWKENLDICSAPKERERISEFVMA